LVRCRDEWSIVSDEVEFYRIVRIVLMCVATRWHCIERFTNTRRQMR
jgi:hypothetical protein